LKPSNYFHSFCKADIPYLSGKTVLTMSWENQIKQFQYYLKIERSLSANSVVAYSQDLEKLSNYVKKEFPGVSPTELTLDQLRSFINDIASLEISEFSQARIISGIKAFFKFLIYEEKIAKDPSFLLQAPKLGR